MKKHINRLFLFTFLNLYAQDVKQFRVLNIRDSTPIENAYISVDNLLKSVTDKQGGFSISGKYKTIQIGHLAFKTKIIYSKEQSVNKIICLEESVEILDEIILTSKRKTKTLLPSIDYRFRKKYSYIINQNSIYVTYIPNNINTTSEIDSIIIEVGEGMGLSRLYAVPFRVNLYKINKKTKLPSDKILDESILTFPNKNRIQDYVYVDVRSFDIEFPKEGIFVAVESLNLLEIQNLNILGAQSPSFKAVKKKNNKYITYEKIYSWDRLTRVRDTIHKDWIDKIMPQPKFIFNFGIKIKY